VTRVMKARKTGTCPACHRLVNVGQLIAKRDTTYARWIHAACLIDLDYTQHTTEEAHA